MPVGDGPESHPVWVCGLKLTVNDGLSALLESHPVWVCGLKQVWKEVAAITIGHTLYGCVD